MKSMVLYFSRSGNCKRIAGKIAGEIGCEKAGITDNISWKGFFGFMKGGFYSLKGRITETTVEGNPEISDYDNIILVAPLWAGRIAPAGYSLLIKEKESIKKLTVVISCDGSDPEKAYSRIEAITGALERKYCISKSLGNEDGIIKEVVNER